MAEYDRLTETEVLQIAERLKADKVEEAFYRINPHLPKKAEREKPRERSAVDGVEKCFIKDHPTINL